MALSAPETLVSCSTTNSSVLYTAPTTYARDLILTNGGPYTVSVSSFTSSTYGAGVLIPPGQSLLLMGPTESMWGITNGSGSAATMYVGQGSVVSVT